MKKVKQQLNKIQVLFLATICLISINTLEAQSDGYDVITLKDGTVYRGAVVEQKPGKYIKLLQLPSRDTVLITLKSIDVLNKEITEKEDVTEVKSTLDLGAIKLFNVNDFHTYVGVSIGGGDYVMYAAQVEIMKTINDKIQLGVGARGIISHSNTTNNSVFVPVTAEFKYELSEHGTGRHNVMANLSAGLNIVADKDYRIGENYVRARMTNGLFVSPTVGYRLNFSREIGMMLSFGYQYNGSKKYVEETDEFITVSNWSNFVLSGSLFF